MARQASTIPPPTETARGTTKRERILRAAIEVFAQNGYFNAKVSEIAKSAGVADGTIYLYFDGKEDLLVTIFREHTRNYLQSLERELAHVRRPSASPSATTWKRSAATARWPSWPRWSCGTASSS